MAREGVEIASRQTFDTRDSAAWLHTAIRDLLKETSVPLSALNAVGISAGPGSYTGLRVGMSAAKGLCYALSIPMVAVNSLEMMARAAAKKYNGFLCPMIDARRMEVFTALYDQDLNVYLPPNNLILTPESFQEQLEAGPITFFGNGSPKWEELTSHENAVFAYINATASDLALASFNLFELKAFCDLAYAEPFYGKEFYSPPPRRVV